MSNTAGLNIANIQVYAEAAAAADRAAGTYDAHQAADPHYYIWQSNFQTIPMGMNGNPEQFVAQMIQAVPGINCIRIPFNANSFNADGTLDPQFERFLIAAAMQGLQLIPVLADGGAQKFNGTAAAIATALDGAILSDLKEAWTHMKAWMADHPSVEAAVYGWELLNEPATYQRAVSQTDRAHQAGMQNQMVSLYMKHMTELAAIASEGSDAKILVSVWGYGGDTATLNETIVDGKSAIDQLRASMGDQLIWSLHYYPGWMGTSGITSPADLQAAWARFIAPLAGDDILMTEINVPGSTTYNPFQPDQIDTATALSFDWLKAAGVGVGWFPALQTGSSGLALIESDGDIRYLNQPSLAAALNAFSFGQDPLAHHGAELVFANLIDATLRNQPGDPDYGGGRRDAVKFAGMGFGYAGDDTLVGSALANNFLYGGAGNDHVIGAKNDDFLFGQDGDDFIASGDGVDYLFGGGGNDTIQGAGLYNTAYGGAGADHFAVKAGAKITVADYAASEGDSWMGSQTGRYVGHSVLDANKDGVSDLRVALSDGGELLFLGMGEAFGIISVLSGLLPFTGTQTQTADILAAAAIAQAGSDPNRLIAPVAAPPVVMAASRPVKATALADSLVGGGADDLINAGNGSDVIYGVGGNDKINGGTGKDLIFGGSGVDALLGAAGDDTIFGGEGNDIVVGGDGKNILSGDGGNDRIDGGLWADLISGGADRDTLAGGSGNDTLAGDDGADSIGAGLGDDWLLGGTGDDVLDAGVGNDLIDGGAGSDTALFIGTKAAVVNLTVQTRQNTGYGQDQLIGIENITSGGGNDLLTGNDLANILTGNAGRDSLTGGNGADVLFGGTGNDSLNGGSGTDVLTGGAGTDALIGGSGADRFVFSSALGVTNIDAIKDFAVGEDRIVLDNFIFKGLSDGDLSAAAFTRNLTGAATDSLDRIIYETDTGKLFYDPDGTGGRARVMFAIVSPDLVLSNADFLVI